jgi:cytochrome c oxidase subunit 1
MNPYLALPFSLLTILVSVPFATILLCLAGTLWGGSFRFTTPMLFALGFLSLVTIGGFGGLTLGVAANDLHLHDTYYVVGHFHVIMGSSVLFGIYAATYFWFPKMFGRMMNERLGKWHFWLSLLGIYAAFIPMHWLGLSGMPRRYYAFTELEFLKPFLSLNIFISIAAFVLIAAQLLFVVNFFWSLWRARRQATTLGAQRLWSGRQVPHPLTATGVRNCRRFTDGLTITASLTRRRTLSRKLSHQRKRQRVANSDWRIKRRRLATGD